MAFWDRWDFYRRKILALQLRVKLFKSPILGTFKNKRKNFPLSFSIPPHKIAWKFDDVMEVLKITKSKDMVILGGDVYRLSGNKPIITGDGWYTNKGDDDAFEVAIEYITKYRARNGDDFAYCPTICPYTILQEPNEQTEK